MYTTNSIEVVISKFNENIDWVKSLDSHVKIIIYDKSNNPIKDSIVLPNIGRETNTYFTHIVKNYNNLSDWVVFSQGYPIDHISYFIDLVNTFPTKKYSPTLRIDECFFYNTCFNNVLVLSDNYGRPHDFRGINVSNTWNALFTSIQPNKFLFSPGCQFIISKRQLHERPLDFYQKCLEITENNQYSPWEFERIMHYVMDPNFK